MRYFDKLVGFFDLLKGDEQVFEDAKCIFRDVIGRGGVIYMFGCGHANVISEEFFYRAGGLACVCPIFYPPLMLHEGAVRASLLEREHGCDFLEEYDLSGSDVMVVVSNSGINPVAIDVALHARVCGCRVITISSFEYRLFCKSRHECGEYLGDVGDVNFNSYVGYGDVMFGVNARYGSCSTVISMAILHEVFVRVLSELEGKCSVDIFRCDNIAGSDLYNQNLVGRYSDVNKWFLRNLE